MLYVVTGGSGSGKSEYAEQLATASGCGRRIYVATMMVWDEEGAKRVSRHVAQRTGKGFETVERFTDLEGFELSGAKGEAPPVVLLECMSNLAANEYYRLGKNAAKAVIRGINALQKKCLDLIIVTNEVSSDGEAYSLETMEYIEVLGEINRYLGLKSDSLTEVVYGIPVPVIRIPRIKSIPMI